MMMVLKTIGILFASYLLGSMPNGWLVVKIFSGKDVRQIESGRTGGTNVMRAAGVGAGILTAVLDVLKAAAAVWLAQALTPNVWLHVFAPLAVILGNNYSIFLAERNEHGHLRLRGGAGGAACAGGSLGLWPPSLLIILPIAALVFLGIGYASVTTMSIGLLVIIVFAVRAWLGLSPWQYIFYGVIAELLLLWALRPNIRRLREGTERLHGWRAKRQQRQAQKE